MSVAKKEQTPATVRDITTISVGRAAKSRFSIAARLRDHEIKEAFNHASELYVGDLSATVDSVLAVRSKSKKSNSKRVIT